MKISVIIPCYNAEAFVHRSVRSVLAQDYQDIEIICVDDGSADQTYSVLMNLNRELNGRLRILQIKNGGAGKARNVGAKEASGVYLQFLDADDELLPSKLSSDVALLKNTQVGMLAGAYIRRVKSADTSVEVSTDNPWIALFNGQLGCTCSNLFQREAFQAAGGWSETLRSSQEVELMMRVLSIDKEVVCNAVPNTIVNVDSSIISKRDPAGNLRRYFDVRLKIYDKIVSAGKVNSSFYENAGYMFFGILHRMYELDAKQALQMHAIVRAKGIKIAEGPGVSSSYKRLNQLFGFSLTEKIFYRR